MIKARLETSDGPVVLIGLSGENMARLMADEPIEFNLSDIGLPPQRVWIIGGSTEDVIAQRLVAQTRLKPR